MSQRAFVPRHMGERERKADYFEEEFQSEREGLGGTEAYDKTLQVQERLTPDGLLLSYHCNCGNPMAPCLDWSEIAAIAYNVVPSHPQLQASNIAWQPYPNQMAFAPVIACRLNCGSPPPVVLITPSEARKHLEKGLANNFTQTDTNFPRVMALLQRMQASRAPAPR